MSEAAPVDPDVGLCATCRHARPHANRRGSTFWQCGAAEGDERLRRYPELPVTRCPAHSVDASAPAQPPASAQRSRNGADPA